MELCISTSANVVVIYNESVDLSALGPESITRASHVEPDATGRWWSDLAPVGGPRLGPFDRRSQGLDAELDWLQTHLAQLARDI